MNRLLRIWRQPIVYRTAIALYVALVLALAGVIFSVNSLDVQSAVYLRADTELETDRLHGVRGAFHYAPTGEVLTPETMEWRLEPTDRTGGDAHDLVFPHGPPEETWPNPTFRLDEVDPGDYDLYLKATHAEVASLETRQPVTVRKRPRPPRALDELRWPRKEFRSDDPRRHDVVEPVDSIDIEPGDDESDETTGDETETGPAEIELAATPPTGELKRGLPQTVVLRTFDADSGRPVPATVRLELTDGMLENDLESPVRTNRLGIATVELQPATRLQFDVRVEPAPDEVSTTESDDETTWAPASFTLDYEVAATQYGLSLANHLVTPDDEIAAAVHTTMPDGTFMADLYDQDGHRLIDALSLRISDGESGVRFDAPDTGEASKLLRLQTYQSLYGTKHAWDSSWVLFVDDDSIDSLRETTYELYDWIADETDSPHHRTLVDRRAFDDRSAAELRALLEAGLEEVPRNFELPPVLMNTRDADRQALDAWREEVQQDLRWMLAITIFAGIMVVLYFVVLGIQRHRREHALIQQLGLDDDELPEDFERRTERLERYAVTLQGLIVLLTLIAFALGILIMVSYL